MKLELLSDDSNRFIQALIDYDINSKDKYGSNLLHYYIMNDKSIVQASGVIPMVVVASPEASGAILTTIAVLSDVSGAISTPVGVIWDGNR